MLHESRCDSWPVRGGQFEAIIHQCEGERARERIEAASNKCCVGYDGPDGPQLAKTGYHTGLIHFVQYLMENLSAWYLRVMLNLWMGNFDV